MTYYIRGSLPNFYLLGIYAEVDGRYFQWGKGVWNELSEGMFEHYRDDDDSHFSEFPLEELEEFEPEAAAAPVVAQADLAQAIATSAHAGQVDKLGADYIGHPARIASRFDPIDQVVEHCAAWLHDVLEDTDATAAELAERGIRRDIIEVVSLLTRDHDEYYERIRENPAALAVKLADIDDNTDPARTALLDDQTRERLAAKYRSARERLLG
jgi:hypothetical protein